MDKLIQRIKFSIQLWRWEQEKRKEGFPQEWFEDIPNDNYRGNPNWAGDD